MAACTHPAAQPATPAVHHGSVWAALVAAAPLIDACSTLCQGYLLYKLGLGAAVSALL